MKKARTKNKREYAPASDYLKQIIDLQSLIASADFDLSGFMQTVVDHMRSLTNASGAVIELLEGEEMVYRAGSGSMTGHLDFRLKAAVSLSGTCVRTGQILYSDDTSTDPRVDAAACKKINAASMVVVPLYRRGRIVGVLKVISDRTHAFSEDDIETLQLMAGLLGGALGQQMEVEKDRQTGERFRHMAQHDALTGLPNRALFHDRLAHAIARNRRNKRILALIYMDIDHFKSINDTHGHAAGDALLKSFADRIQSTVRASDTFARLSGDEFVMIAEDIKTPEGVACLAEKILEAMRPEFLLEGQHLHATLSMGIAIHTGMPTEPETLLKEADTALYKAKKAGRGRYWMAETRWEREEVGV